MLFLRRCVGESLLIFDTRTETHIHVIGLDLDAKTATLVIQGVNNDKPITLAKGHSENFLQGVASVTVASFYEFDSYPPAVQLGIRAPRDLAVHREEKIRDLTRDQRIDMARMRAEMR